LILLGKLIVMPMNSEFRSEEMEATSPADQQAELAFDAKLWLSAPRERSQSYFPVYSAVSQAIQASLRTWVKDWLNENAATLERKVSVCSLLAFSCTKPYRGRPVNLFTYDIQQTIAIDRAVRSAATLLQAEVKTLRQSQPAETPVAQTLIAPRVMHVVNRNRRPIYRMFTIETNLMNEVLKFTQINIAKLGLEKAAMELRAGFARHLHRFSEKFDMAERCDDLLRIATDALRTRPADENQMPLAA
jgi:hypothetical protein